MMMKALKDQKGDVVVEAAVIFPAAILMVIILLYLSIILFQKANLQAGLETALTYYKSTVTDMYVSAQKAAVYEAKDGTTSADGNIYNAASPINPYEELFGNVHKLNQKTFLTALPEICCSPAKLKLHSNTKIMSFTKNWRQVPYRRYSFRLIFRLLVWTISIPSRQTQK